MTTANKITILRILLIPFFVVQTLYYTKEGHEVYRWLALISFGIAAVCDGVDGYVARHYNQRSELGAVLDPLADKLLLVSGIVVLSFDHCPLPGQRAALAHGHDHRARCAAAGRPGGHPARRRQADGQAPNSGQGSHGAADGRGALDPAEMEREVAERLDLGRRHLHGCLGLAVRLGWHAAVERSPLVQSEAHRDAGIYGKSN